VDGFSTTHLALLLLAAGVLGALLPLPRRWTERGLHLFVALAAGIFLGTIFLHLLPHLAGGEVHEGHDHGPVPHGSGPWVAALGGLLLLFVVERVWLRRAGHHHHAHHHHGPRAHQHGHAQAGVGAAGEAGLESPHSVLWVATFIGLSLHALTAGFAYAGALEGGAASTQLVVSILLHKATETFSLATVLRLAGMGLSRALAWLALFVLIEPAGLLLGGTVLAWSPELDPLLTGFALGTFLYVALCDLLPEVFHGAKRPVREFAAVLLGIGVTAATMGDYGALLPQARAVLDSSWSLFLQMAPLLLVGFLLAGVVKRYLSTAWLARKMGGDDLKSVAWAAAVGAPLPLCSCSVVPVALSLRKGGASKGATSAFTISTPETGVDSVAASWSLLGPLMTVLRPIAAVITAFASGAAVNWLVKSGLDREPAGRPGRGDQEDCEHCAPAPPPPCCAKGEQHAAERVVAKALSSSATFAPSKASSAIGAAAPIAPAGAARASLAHEHEHEHGAARPRPAWRAILRYAYVDVLDDVAPSLLVGLLVAGVLGALLPIEALEASALQGASGLFVMLLVGVPLYVCASASTPIAAALLAKGLSPGAALVFLLVGPATNSATLVVLAKSLGWRFVAVQLAALCATTLALGALVDLWAPATIANQARACVHAEAGWPNHAAALVLGALLVVSLVRTRAGLDLVDDLRAKG
jgi:uncharacterized membrane protein YraQ (UPF0718 family)/zinc transporter ZupT